MRIVATQQNRETLGGVLIGFVLCGVAHRRSTISRMRVTSIRSLSEVVGTLGVLTGLGFVGLELRNSTAVARAETRREIAAQNIEMVMRIAEDGDLIRLWSEPWTMDCVDGLSRVDRERLVYSVIALILRLESTYMQSGEGLIETTDLGGYGFNQPHIRDAWFKDWWSSFSPGLDPGFVAYVEALNDY